MIVQFLAVRRLKRSFHILPASKLALEYSKNEQLVKVFVSYLVRDQEIRSLWTLRFGSFARPPIAL